MPPKNALEKLVIKRKRMRLLKWQIKVAKKNILGYHGEIRIKKVISRQSL